MYVLIDEVQEVRIVKQMARAEYSPADPTSLLTECIKYEAAVQSETDQEGLPT